VNLAVIRGKNALIWK